MIRVMELWIKNVKFGLIHHSLPFINLQQKERQSKHFYATHKESIRFTKRMFFCAAKE